MFLIAVGGAVGAGKTSLLAQLANWFQAQGKSVDGFIAEAGERAEAGRGASRYDLRWVRSGEVTPFAARNGASALPYQFNTETEEQVKQWAQQLATQPPLSLIVLDEFGKLEAAGKGHIAIWKELVKAQPEVVAVAIREENREAIEKHLGRAFDLQIDAESPDAWERLRAACVAHADWMRVGLYGGTSGAIEVTLGSVLHGAQVPMRGLILSSLQAAIMVRAGEGLGQRLRVTWVSFIAAGLKALSPAGSRLRPMLAISIQGLFFGIATRVAGWNWLGIAIGSWLVGAWAISQGLILQYLLIGNELLKAYSAVVEWTHEHWGVGNVQIATVLAAWISLWGFVASAVGVLARRRSSMPEWLKELMARKAAKVSKSISTDAPRRSWREAFKRGARDVLRPSFWTPIVIVIVVLFAAGSGWEAIFWVIFRAAAVGIVLFSLVYAFDVRGFLNWLRKRGHWGPALAFTRALSRLKQDEAK